MTAFSQIDPARKIHYGNGLLDKVGDTVDQLDPDKGPRRVLVVAGENMAKSPLLVRLKKALGDRLGGELLGITPHSNPDWVRKGLAIARENRCDVIVSIGGGSTIDTAKCIALAALLGGDIADLRIVPPYNAALNAQKMQEPALPHICIPTTGSGSEVTPGAGLRAPDGRKWIFWNVSMPPQVILLDPEAAATTPVRIAAGSSMNSLAHAVEALYAVNRQAVTDAFALAAMEKFGQWLPRMTASPDDVDVRGEIQQAWLLGGMSICNARTALHHTMCHCLGARFDVSHGVANTIMLPHVMEFNRETTQSQMARAGRAFGHFGTEAESARGAVEAVHGLQAATGLPTRLRDAGVPESGLSDLAEDAMHERGTHFNPRKVEHADVLEIYRRAW
ncbi:iron-containing alcohol dehydrogenase family protein [Hydrogenophaga sp.]|uniref:iron-containing alcohol dehydrogenase family protein n=1 Tax=Hydrogenophaga sp. TaxID=1904254 RepID=UPI0027168A2B|nr:iron-containing alcohol dehydrogenase [Hydrogenophaga sp.]MDO9435456.1 iron-containing alcohol dehydrogenase [Hydrogenophaga sp.]